MAGLIERPRVERSLREAVTHAPLTLLHAPVGAGKTSAAALAFRDAGTAVWMDAQPWHRGAFIRAIVDAVRAARPEFGRMTVGALEAGASATHLGHLFATDLSHVDEELFVIVDNAHVFAGDERFLKFVDAAVSELPEKVHILAMGRSLPDTPLVRSFGRGRVTILDAAVLALDADEIRAFGRRYGRDLDEESVRRIASATEGWAAGAALMLATPGEMIAAGARQLLADLGRENREFLERACVFETLDLRVLGKHDAFADARDRLADLRRRGALISQVDEDVYRVHPLLRDLLLMRARERNREAAGHRLAAECYLLSGNIAAGLYHANAADEPNTAARALHAYVEAAFAAGEHERLRSLLEQIDLNGPDAAIRLYTQGLFEKSEGAQSARDTFARAARAAQEGGDAPLAFKARAQILEHDFGRLCAIDQHEVDDLLNRAAAVGPLAQARAAMLSGWARAVTHDFTGALDTIAPLSGATDPTARFNIDILRAYALTSLGRADEAQDVLDALIEFLEDSQSVVLQTLTLVWFARLALLWGKTTIAADAAAQAQRLTQALSLRAEQAALLAALAEIATHQGDVQAAVKYAQHARASAGRAWYAADVRRVDAFASIALARAAFLGHDNAIARDLALRAADDPDTPAVQRALGLAEAAIYALLCEPASSASVIERAREAVQQAAPIDAGDSVSLVIADDILAFLDAANGKQHEPLLTNCEPFRGLTEFRRGLVPLELAGVAAGNARRGTAESIVAFETAMEVLERDGPRFEAQLARAYAATFITSKHVTAQPAAAPDLTAREREILTLLADGLSNKEIAQRLVLSPRTVETHVERVLGKLEVGSRARAIAKAVRLGLVALEPV